MAILPVPPFNDTPLPGVTATLGGVAPLIILISVPSAKGSLENGSMVIVVAPAALEYMNAPSCTLS
jgi:hypothetical protein